MTRIRVLAAALRELAINVKYADVVQRAIRRGDEIRSPSRRGARLVHDAKLREDFLEGCDEETREGARDTSSPRERKTGS